MKEELDNTKIIEISNTLLSMMYRTFRQKINKETDDLTNTVDQTGVFQVASVVKNLHAGETLLTLYIKHLFYVTYSVRLWGSKINTVRFFKK